MTEKVQNQPRLIPRAGEDDFEILRQSGIYYADKTQYLKPLFLGTDRRFLLLRPRRFGKTLTMTTLRSFLEMDYQHHGDTSRQQELFRGLKVTADRGFCEQHMGQYPVVALSLKDTDGINFRKVFSRLLDDDLLCSGTAEAIKTLQSSLVTICSALFRHCGRKPVLLIDEYDVPLQKAAMTG